MLIMGIKQYCDVISVMRMLEDEHDKVVHNIWFHTVDEILRIVF